MASKKSLKKRIQAVVTERCTPAENALYDYAIGTKLGLLWVSPHSDWIACRFDNVEKARAVYTCNPYSGKYNFHGDSCVEDFSDLVEDLKGQNRLLDTSGFENQLNQYKAQM